VTSFASLHSTENSVRVIPTILKKNLEIGSFFLINDAILTCFARSPELFGWSQKRGSAPRYEFRFAALYRKFRSCHPDHFKKEP
ncbi:MAG: hypothetical protein K6E29_02295, partial [Cyanobacteria bacterium RUI128]|nr:hypothetical protein [Cyanobacteria bacterium RUI128]